MARFFGSAHNCRRVDDVVREIEHDDLRFVLFTDDNLTANRPAAKALCRALIPLKVRWATQVSIDVVQDKELLSLMAESGCIGQLIGFDSINPESLRWMKKSPNLRSDERYQTAVERMRQYGFQIWASFMLGNDYDSVECIQDTIRFAIASKFTLAFFHILVPYPGTPLFEDFRRSRRLLFGGKWWLSPDFRYNTATFLPKLMTPAELGEITVRANKEFYSVRSILTRSLDTRTNINSLEKFVLYVKFNLLIRSTST